MATRRERVVLELDDQFTTGMARAAAQAAALAAALNSLDGSGRRGSNATRSMAADVDRVSVVATKADRSINQLTGRIRLLTDVASVLGPGLIPIGAVGIPAITGLAAGFGFAATAGATMIGAFQGVGDALKAMNKAGLEPTAANVEAAKQAMQQISPAARDFVKELRATWPALKSLRDLGATEMFPGFTKGLDALETRLPDVQRIVGAVAGELGDIGAEVGESFASERWDEFFEFLATDTPQALEDIAEATGNVTHAMAELWMAFDPLNDDFSNFLVDSTKGLDEWAMGLSQTQGFQEFIDYVRTTGPQVADTMGAIGSALVQIVQAAAPLGGPVLQGLESLAKAIGSIADSDLGTPIFTALAALALYNRTLGKTGVLSQSAFGKKAKANALGYRSTLLTLTTAQDRARMSGAQLVAMEQKKATAWRGSLAAAGKGAAGIALLGVATTGVAEKVGLTNTAMLGLTGFMLGGAPGAAFGAVAGAAMDLTHANDGLNDSLERLSTVAGQVDLGTFNKALGEAKAQLDDFTNVSGVGDALSDTAKAFGGALSGKGGFWAQKGDAQGQIDDAVGAQKWAATVKEMQAAAMAGARFASASAAGLQLTAAGAREAAGGLKALTAAFTAANAVMGRQQSWDDYRGALLDAKDAIAETGRTLNKNGSIIKGQGRDMQRLGLTSRTTLRGMAAGAQETATKMQDFAKRTQFLQRARRDFVGLATGMGMSRRAARGLADDLGLVSRINAKPTIEEQGAEASRKRIAKMNAEIKQLKDKQVKMSERGAQNAAARVRALQAAINALRDRTVTTTFVTRRINRGASGQVGSPGLATAEAYGGIHMGGHKVFARGGFGDVANRHMPELAGPGPTRVWREPETMGEAYIPLANDDRRPRARAIAAETVSLLGGTAYFADGGFTGARGRGKNDGDKDGKHVALWRRQVKRLTAEMEKNKKAIEKERTARDDLVGKRNDLSSTVGGAFTTDLFGSQPDNLSWMNPAQKQAALTGGVLDTLKADIANANAFKSTLYSLKGRGLDGQALAELASSGDLGRAQAFANMSKSDLANYETLYNQRAAATSAVGIYAGNAVYGAQITSMNGHLAELVKENKGLRADIRWLQKHQKPINITEALNGRRTAKEVARRQAMAR